MSESPDFDDQDGAEALDETMLDDDRELGGEARTFEELPDLLDLTQADGDRDEDEAVALDADEFDPEAIDDADTQEDDGQGPEDGFDEDRLSAGDVEGLDQVADADLAEGGEDDVTDYQSTTVSDADLDSLGYSKRP